MGNGSITTFSCQFFAFHIKQTKKKTKKQKRPLRKQKLKLASLTAKEMK